MIVAITGASAGIGRATAEAFAARGWDVALLARNAERLNSAAETLRARGVKALPLVVDVADPDAIERAAEHIESELGPIDVWVNNAMATVFSPVACVTPVEFRRGTEVTYLGQVYGTMAALKRMRVRNRGTIVNVGSALSYRAIPLQSVYCGAKYAVRGFTDALRSELLHERSAVRIVMVHLPAVNTPQFDWALNKTARRPQPVPPIYQPEVPARAIYFAATKLWRRELWVGPSTIKAIVANKIAPGLLDRYLARAGYEGQLTDEPPPSGAPANLFETVDGDFRAHGRFDRQARDESLELLARRNAAPLLAGCVAILALAGLFLCRRSAPSGYR